MIFFIVILLYNEFIMLKAFDIVVKNKAAINNTGSSHINQQTSSPGSNYRKNSLIYFILVIILAYILYDLIDFKKMNQSENIDTTTPNDLATNPDNNRNRQIVNNDLEKSEGNLQNEQSELNQKNELTSKDEVIIDKKNIKIKILNAAAIKNLAAQTKTLLEQNGFRVESIATAKTISEQTTIYYNTNKNKEADLVKEIFKDKDVKLEENSLITDKYDILLTMGIKH